MTSSPPIDSKKPKPPSFPIGSHISHLLSRIGHVLGHASHVFDHAIRPSVGSLGHATKKVRWHRSYDDTENGADRSSRGSPSAPVSTPHPSVTPTLKDR